MTGELRVNLTPFQRKEVAHGMSVDADDNIPQWGRIEGRTLVITNLDLALWRITSSRDIWRDNGAEDRSYRPGARSLDLLVDRVVAAAGGRATVVATVTPETVRWL